MYGDRLALRQPCVLCKCTLRAILSGEKAHSLSGPSSVRFRLPSDALAAKAEKC